MEHKLTRPSRGIASGSAQRRRALMLAYDSRVGQAAALAQRMKRADRPVLRMVWTLDDATGRPVCVWRVAGAHPVETGPEAIEAVPAEPPLRRAA
ncbi:hypothetical protein [Marinivivus vitaminiproducens]|uniref:hypothetical protein n=1 Tax=Marinivivus vitaminiproducens TaxID=3035935 RepID=UPI0027A38027|nr:hypothetical protein P4R82_13350 [Geminicoccaceae bacterium SCSIO 64248]